MFDRLDGYIKTVEDERVGLSERIKSFKSANVRIKKIRAEIQDTVEQIEEYEPEPEQLKIKDWHDHFQQVHSRVDNLSTVEFGELVSEYQQIMDTITGLQVLLDKQAVSVDKIIESTSGLEPVPIPEFKQVNNEPVQNITATDLDE